jgi:zinc D-Ala-D-Ala carboxypeptidase
MKISPNITYAEAIHSETAKRKGIDNTPNPTQIEAMKLLAEKVFQPLREWVGGPIKVNSFFRSADLNEAIGGSKTSQHCKGQAIDIDDVFVRRR